MTPPCQQNNRTETSCAKLYCSEMFLRTVTDAFTVIFRMCLSGWEGDVFSLN